MQRARRRSSGDLDFVLEEFSPVGVEARMQELGFVRRSGHFAHPECEHLFVEFVTGPLGIGDDLDIVPQEELVDGHVLKILSPTDCIRDRLASYIHFRARECLDQAILVANAHRVEWETIRRWCLTEGERGGLAFDELTSLSTPPS